MMCQVERLLISQHQFLGLKRGEKHFFRFSFLQIMNLQNIMLLVSFVTVLFKYK